MRRNHRRFLFTSAARRGEDLIVAGLLTLAGPVDLDELAERLAVAAASHDQYPGGSNHTSEMTPDLSQSLKGCIERGDKPHSI
jgi:hypothetical protein